MKGALLIGLVAASFLAGCRAPLEGAPCPCIIGFVCSVAENVCIPATSGVPDAGSSELDAANFPDGGLPDADITRDADITPDADPGEPDADVSPDASQADAALLTELQDE